MKIHKRISVIMVFLMLIGTLIGCSDEEAAVQPKKEDTKVEKKDDTKEEESEEFVVEWEDNVVIDEKSINIDITTNLKDGTKLMYEVRNDGSDEDRLDGNLEVRQGKATGQLDISNFGPGEITVNIRFYPFQQSDALIKLYGGQGENLKGERVVEKNVGKVIAVEKTYNKK